MTSVDLSASHINALSKFFGVRALTETSLARALSVDKAVARHALSVLVSHELVKRYASWEYAITKKGAELLASKGLITSAEEKPKGKRKVTATIVGADVQADGIVFGEPESASLVLVVPPEQAEAVTARVWAGKPYSDLSKDLEGVNYSSVLTTELPAPSDFDKLVRQGLERLNQQLKYQQITIEDRDLKISTLASLADTLDGFDKSISLILRAIATDLNKFK